MRWICKVTEYNNQKRITLPKKFIELHGLKKAKYIEIDDRNPEKIIIGGLFNGKAKKAICG